jgi:ring-1,2-phenylacetyl-CoA epoxidase subunit PaaD
VTAAASGAASLPAVDTVWDWLAEVPDPEIPVIGLVDLGVIRDVAWHGDTLEVTLTPTYSGCPASTVIQIEIDRALRGRGIAKLQFKRQLSPPWTTDWITERGRAALRAYGIAPPGTTACPRCGSPQTSEISRFGSTPCKAQYRCDDCLEPFDLFKCI